jgi:hypothetical protein
MVIGYKYGLKILVPLGITWKPSLKLWLVTLVGNEPLFERLEPKVAS